MSIPSAAARRLRRAGIVTASAVVAAVALFATGLGGVASAKTVAHASTTGPNQAAGPPPVPQIVPKPVSMKVSSDWFTLTSRARIAVNGGGAGAMAVAQDLAGYLRPATGFRLPVVTGPGGPGDISLTMSARDAVGSDPDGEGYRLGSRRAPCG